MSRIDTWIEQLPAFTNKDFQTVCQAVKKEAECREDYKVFSNFRRKTLPADIRDDLSSEDSPGEFGEHVRLVVETWFKRLKCRQHGYALSNYKKPSRS